MSHYIDDEFNNNSVTNNLVTPENEYSQNIDAEFSSHRNNSIPKDEFSSKDKGSTHTQNNENLNKLTEKVAETSGEAVTVTSSGVASNIAATSSSIIAAAATVTIVAIGTVTGISVALHDYSYKFNEFSVSANELTYELLITDNNKDKEKMLSYEDFEHDRESEENAPFTLRVYNVNYDFSHSLWLGFNYNTFSGLTLGQTYNIVLSESRYGGEVLFEESFTTQETTKFRGFSISGSANFVDQTFDVELDYVDSTNSFSDFTLRLEDIELPEELAVEYILEPKPGKQAVSAMGVDGERLDLHRTYNYKFSYKNNGETIDFSEGQVSFIDTSGAVSTFNSLTINPDVDFEGNSFNVQLDYDDPIGEFYSFYLNMETDSSAYISNSATFYLETMTDEQTIDVYGYDFDFNAKYNYSLLVYKYDGEETIQTGTIEFQDKLGRESYFDKFIFDKTANFKTEEIMFQLSFVDDLNYFDNFVVTFTNKDDGSVIPIELLPTTEEQPKPTREYDLSFEYNYTYRLTAEYKGVEVVLVEELNPFIFEDSATYQSGLYGFMFIGGEAKYSDRSFNVALDFADDYDCLDTFILTLYDEENDTSIDIELDETTDEQTVIANETQANDTTGEAEYKVDIVSHPITYNVTCQKHDGGSVETLKLFDEPQSVKFSNSEFISFEYTTGLYRENADDYYSMGMKFNYIDENENIFSDWHVVLYDSSDSNICETWLTNDDHAYDWNYYLIIPYGDPALVDTIVGASSNIRVFANIYDENTGISTYDVELFVKEGEILVNTDECDPQIFGITMENYVAYGDFELTVRSLMYQGPSDMFLDVQLVIETQSGSIYTYDIDATMGSFSVFLSQPNENDFDADVFDSELSSPVTIKIKYRYYISSDPGTGTGSSDPQLEPSDLQELICYPDYKFEVGH